MGPGVTLTLLTPDRYYNSSRIGVNTFVEKAGISKTEPGMRTIDWQIPQSGLRSGFVTVPGIRLFLIIIIHILHSLLEFLDASTHATHELRQLGSTKQDQHDHQDDDHFLGAKAEDECREDLHARKYIIAAD